MTAPATLEERVTTLEGTVKQLITSLRPPDTALRQIERDIQSLMDTTAVTRSNILDMAAESVEVQRLQAQTVKTVTRHSRELAEIKTTVAQHSEELAEIKTTVAQHSHELAEIMTTVAQHSHELAEIKSTLNEHGTLLRDLSATLNVIVTKLDER
jgi:chromosome segregation ATPase